MRAVCSEGHVFRLRGGQVQKRAGPRPERASQPPLQVVVHNMEASTALGLHAFAEALPQVWRRAWWGAVMGGLIYGLWEEGGWVTVMMVVAV